MSRVPAVIAASGLVLLVVGTFLPWLRSGTVDRNSYQAAAVAGEFLGAPAFRLWLGVPLLGALCVALFVLGLARTAATVTALFATAAAVVAVLATVRTGGSSAVSVSPSGPATTLIGAVIALTGAAAAVLVARPRTGGVP